MTDTVNLGLPCIEGSQAQKHVTHNDALRILDTLVQLAVLDRDLTAPPGAPQEGQRWIVKTGATGFWAGHDNAIAAWQDGSWQFSVPQVGWTAFVVDEGTLVVWNGSSWGDFFTAVTSIQNLAMLGVGTTADVTNPLSAKLNNALFAAKSVAEGGDGHLRYKLSKESAAKTLSFLFQDNYSGRAEIGLTGDDDFHFKVSPDGSSWHDGIVIDRNTGAVTFPNTSIAGGGRERLAANRTYYVRPDGSDSNNGLANTSGGAFLTIQKALDVILGSLDLANFDVAIQVADGTYTGRVDFLSPQVGAGTITIQGNNAIPSNVVISTTGTTFQDAAFRCVGRGVRLVIKDLKIQTATHGSCIVSDVGASVSISNLVFGASARFHLEASTDGHIRIIGGYTIAGNAGCHFLAVYTAVVDTGLGAYTVTLSGTPAFSSSFAFCTGLSVMDMFGVTFSGAAVGPRYTVVDNAVIQAYGGGANYFPGDVAGSTSTGGIYA